MSDSAHSTAAAGLSTGEAELLRRVKAGDERAFEELVRAHSPRMLAASLRLLGSDAEAQDAVQDAFLSAFRALDGFDGQSSLGTWLYRIAINASLMRLRSRKRKRAVSIEELLPTYLDDGHRQDIRSAWTSAPEQLLAKSEVRELVRQKIDMLPDDYRTVILLRDIEEMTTEDAARILDLTPAAVKSRLHRARQALRTLLERGIEDVPELTCKEFIEFLDDYIAGTQPAAVRAAFERHLAICAACLDYLRMYRETIEFARGAMQNPSDPVPKTVPDDIVKAILKARRQA